ncbi:unnamed protein product [Lampetra fluviatilis]
MPNGVVVAECSRVLLMFCLLHVHHCRFSAAEVAPNSLTPCAVMGVVHAESPRGRYRLSLEDAWTLCRAAGTELATLEQLRNANAHGFQVCRSGWVQGGVSAVPRVRPLPQCAHNLTGVVLDPISTARLDAFCYNASETRVNSCDPSLGTRSPPLVKGTSAKPGTESTATPDPGARTTGAIHIAHRSPIVNGLPTNSRAAAGSNVTRPTSAARMNTTSEPAGGNTSGTASNVALQTTAHHGAASSSPALSTTLLNNLTSTTLNATQGVTAGGTKSLLSEEVIITIAVIGGVIALCLLATIIYSLVFGCGKRKQVDVSDGKNRKPKKSSAELMSPYVEFQPRGSTGDSLESVPLHTQPGSVNGVNGSAYTGL